MASVLWRDGARLGLIVLRESDGVAATRSAAIQYAVLAESYLTTALPTTAWQKVMAQVQPDGAVSEQTALEAVALSYGRLPGVHVPSGARSATVSGDLAEDWVTPYLPRLKGRLRKAVYRSLGLTPPGVTAHTASYGDADFQPDATLTAAANKWKLVYALPTYLGHYLSLPIVAGDSFATNGTAPADATTVDQDGTNYCRVRLLPASKDYDASTISHILAHEVFHCEEFDFDPGLAHLGAWVVEGMAEWAAETLAPVPGYLGVLDDYTLTPHTPLFARSYDAEGFWGHIQDTSPDLWQEGREHPRPAHPGGAVQHRRWHDLRLPLDLGGKPLQQPGVRAGLVDPQPADSPVARPERDDHRSRPDRGGALYGRRLCHQPDGAASCGCRSRPATTRCSARDEPHQPRTTSCSAPEIHRPRVNVRAARPGRCRRPSRSRSGDTRGHR